MFTALDISDAPIITSANADRVSPRKWASLLAKLLGPDAECRLLLRGEWRTVRTVAELQAYVKAGGKVW